MSVAKIRFPVFLLLIVVAFATFAHAQPDGSQSFNSVEWDWALYSVGNQFVDLANHNFSQTTSNALTDDTTESRAHAQPRTGPPHAQAYRAVDGDRAIYASSQFQNAHSAPFNTPRSVPSYAEGHSITTFPEEVIMSQAVQGGMMGSIQQWRPAQATAIDPFSTAVQSSAMTQTHATQDMGYPSAHPLPLNQPFIDPSMHQGMRHPPVQGDASLSFEAPRSYPYQSGQPLSDASIYNDRASGALSDDSAQLTVDVTNNYNFQAGMNESPGGMLGWLQRASTFGDRVMPRVETNLLQPPPSGVRTTQAPPSPSSASTTNSSGRFGSTKRNRAQMIVGQHPFACHLCSAGFRAQGDLTHHLRCHQPYENRAHLCMQCGKRFQYRKDLNRHLPKHDPNAPRHYCPHYGCKYASKGFGRQDHLDRHVSTQHRADTPQQGTSPGYA